MPRSMVPQGRGPGQARVQAPHCLWGCMDTGVTRGPASRRAAAQGRVNGEGAQWGVPGVEQRQCPGPAWQPRGSWRHPSEPQGTALLRAKRLLPSQVMTAGEVPPSAPRQDRRGAGCVRRGVCLSAASFRPELGSLVGLKDASDATPGPAGLGQMGSWRGVWPWPRSDQQGSQPAPHPCLRPWRGQVGPRGRGGSAARDPPTVRGQAIVPNATLSAGMMVVPGGGPGATGSLGGGAHA